MDVMRIRLKDNPTKPPSRLRRRSCLTTAICLLLITLVAAPFSTETLPGPLKDLAAPSPVRAQDPAPDDTDDDDTDEPAYTTGTPASCPSSPIGWVTRSENCELNIPVPCPTGYPNLSLSFPAYCYTEASGEASKPPECSSPGVSNAVVISVNARTCRIHVLRTCPAGVLLREGWTDGTDWDEDRDGDVDTAYDANDDDLVDDEHHYLRCKAIQRRSWTCPDGYLTSNQFNSCYRPSSGELAEGTTHPACDTISGAPAFTVLECGSYAGGDYDNSRTCPSVSSSFTAATGGASALYWCTFDSAKLNVDCNRTTVPSGADCAVNTAYCLMRASRTGGCDAILRNLTCARLQAAYVDATNKETAGQNASRSGCSPCLVLPFASVSGSCPDEITGQPTNSLANRAYIASVKSNGGHLRRGSSSCQNPPPGRLEMRSLHQTRLPVVNIDLILTFRDIPEFSYSYSPRYDNPINVYGRNTIYENRYINILTDDETIRLARIPTGTQTSWSSVGECAVDFAPVFFIKVEELWPGNSADHRTRIINLFGSDALDWWNDLTTEEKTRLNTAYGQNLYSAEHNCHLEPPIWCKWKPEKAGYYSVTGLTIARATEKEFALRNPSTGERIPTSGESFDLWEAVFPITRKQSTIANQLRDYFDGAKIQIPSSIWHSSGSSQTSDHEGNQITVYYDYASAITKIIDSGGNTITLGDNGSINDEVTAAILMGKIDPEALNSFVIGGSGSRDYGIYTETEPIGVQVNEVRVLTRKPSG